MRQIVHVSICCLIILVNNKVSAQLGYPDNINSISRANTFIKQNHTHIDYNNALLNNLLIEKFPSLMENANNFLLDTFAIVHQDEVITSRYYFSALFNNETNVNWDQLEIDYTEEEGISHFLLWCLFPDFLVKDDIIDSILSSIHMETNPRQLAHIALGISWMNELHKSSTYIEELNISSEQIIDKLEPIFTQANLMINDSNLEGIVAKLILDKADNSDFRLIEQIIKAQRADGGWSYDGKSSTSSIHSTLIALWILLEYSSMQN